VNRVAVGLLLLLVSACGHAPDEDRPMTLSASDLARQLRTGELTATEVTRDYLSRIDALNAAGPRLGAVLELNPHALYDAGALDDAFVRSGPVGPLHGLPVLIKGNIDVEGLTASAGSLALADIKATEDAHLVARLRAAGAVILGTTNLSEWANFRDGNSTSGWSSLGGQTRNPHVLDRNPCGSSSGSAVAVAAHLAPLAVGTETHGSIVCPASVNGVVGIKPTVGLVSRSGIVPISHTQDTAGPMARSVMGAAMLLQAMIDPDPSDPGSVAAGFESVLPDPSVTDLAGRRIGILRKYRGADSRPRVEAIHAEAVGLLGALGATLVDPVQHSPGEGFWAAAYRVLLREFRVDLNDYLAAHHLPDDRDSLADLIVYNDANAESVMPVFGQSIFIEAEAMSGLDDPEYAADVALVQTGLRRDLDALFASHGLDAIFIPVNGPAWKTDWVNGDHTSFGGTAYLAALSGYPSVVLPAGTVDGLPVGVGFVGLPQSEPLLLQMAYALEQALPPAPEPAFRPSIENP
jgi:amidase